MFECRKCKAEMDKKTFYGLFYGKDGTRKIVCVRCGSALIITKKRGDIDGDEGFREIRNRKREGI
jgi:DNA-directed RNA polymerase subunit RPC12/RpoP